MIGGDVTVAWMDHNSGKGYAEDYYLDAKSQCAGSRGSCPDSNIPLGKNDVKLLNSAVINEFTMLTYRRPLARDDQYDTSIATNQSHAVIWAMGPINSKGEVSYHQKRINQKLLVDFGRIPKWNCPIAGQPNRGSKKPSRVQEPKKAPKSAKPWYVPPIQCHEPADGVFFAQIGPTGGNAGYPAITGHVGWGIAWYINGLLIPEIYVVRGKTYTFVIEGGNDPDSPAAYHPFYITDDKEGGYQYKKPDQRRRTRVFAGIENNRLSGASPSGIGRLCEWREDPQQPAETFTSFGAYQRSLTLDCKEGQPGIIQWTPDRDTPDLVYYQCYTHRYLGWKIHVVDSCDQ